MGYNISKPLAINGFVNLLTALVAAGYTGPAILEIGGFLQNTDAAVDGYIHFNNSSSTAPATGTDGMAFGPVADFASWPLPRGTDLSTAWLFSASAISVKAAIQG